jgi:ribosomal protein S18 acetylase RimI-like enzyme
MEPPPPAEAVVEVVDHDDPRAAELFDEYLAELEARVPGEVSYHPSTRPDAVVFSPPAGRLFVAVVDGAPAGTAGLKRLDDDTGELKRLFVRPTGRGSGVGRRLLRAAEAAAIEIGYSTVRLDTRTELVEAARLYERTGYRRIDRYNDNPTANAFWEKALPAAR